MSVENNTSNTQQQQQQRTITKSVLLTNENTQQRYLLPNFKVSVNEGGDIDLMHIIEALRCFPVTGAMIFYYDNDEKMYINVGTEPIAEQQKFVKDNFGDQVKLCFLPPHVRATPAEDSADARNRQQHQNGHSTAIKQESDIQKTGGGPRSSNEGNGAAKSGGGDSYNSGDEDGDDDGEDGARQMTDSKATLLQQKRIGRRKNHNHEKRVKERQIVHVLQLVESWRQLHEGAEKLNLDAAAQRVNIARKTLDDYHLCLRRAKACGFDFEKYKFEKMGFMRKFIKENFPKDGNSASLPPMSVTVPTYLHANGGTGQSTGAQAFGVATCSTYGNSCFFEPQGQHQHQHQHQQQQRSGFTRATNAIQGNGTTNNNCKTAAPILMHTQRQNHQHFLQSHNAASAAAVAAALHTGSMNNLPTGLGNSILTPLSNNVRAQLLNALGDSIYLQHDSVNGKQHQQQHQQQHMNGNQEEFSHDAARASQAFGVPQLSNSCRLGGAGGGGGTGAPNKGADDSGCSFGAANASQHNPFPKHPDDLKQYQALHNHQHQQQQQQVPKGVIAPSLNSSCNSKDVNYNDQHHANSQQMDIERQQQIRLSFFGQNSLQPYMSKNSTSSNNNANNNNNTKNGSVNGNNSLANSGTYMHTMPTFAFPQATGGAKTGGILNNSLPLCSPVPRKQETAFPNGLYGNPMPNNIVNMALIATAAATNNGMGGGNLGVLLAAAAAGGAGGGANGNNNTTNNNSMMGLPGLNGSEYLQTNSNNPLTPIDRYPQNGVGPRGLGNSDNLGRSQPMCDALIDKNLDHRL